MDVSRIPSAQEIWEERRKDLNHMHRRMSQTPPGTSTQTRKARSNPLPRVSTSSRDARRKDLKGGHHTVVPPLKRRSAPNSEGDADSWDEASEGDSELNFGPSSSDASAHHKRHSRHMMVPPPQPPLMMAPHGYNPYFSPYYAPYPIPYMNPMEMLQRQPKTSSLRRAKKEERREKKRVRIKDPDDEDTASPPERSVAKPWGSPVTKESGTNTAKAEMETRRHDMGSSPLPVHPNVATSMPKLRTPETNYIKPNVTLKSKTIPAYSADSFLMQYARAHEQFDRQREAERLTQPTVRQDVWSPAGHSSDDVPPTPLPPDTRQDYLAVQQPQTNDIRNGSPPDSRRLQEWVRRSYQPPVPERQDFTSRDVVTDRSDSELMDGNKRLSKYFRQLRSLDNFIETQQKKLVNKKTRKLAYIAPAQISTRLPDIIEVPATVPSPQPNTAELLEKHYDVEVDASPQVPPLVFTPPPAPKLETPTPDVEEEFQLTSNVDADEDQFEEDTYVPPIRINPFADIGEESEFVYKPAVSPPIPVVSPDYKRREEDLPHYFDTDLMYREYIADVVNEIIDDVIEVDLGVQAKQVMTHDGVDRVFDDFVMTPVVAKELKSIILEVVNDLAEKEQKLKKKALAEVADTYVLSSLMLDHILQDLQLQGNIWSSELVTDKLLDDFITTMVLVKAADIPKTRDLTLENTPLKRFHEKVVTDVAIDVFCNELIKSLDIDMAELDDFETGRDLSYPFVRDTNNNGLTSRASTSNNITRRHLPNEDLMFYS